VYVFFSRILVRGLDKFDSRQSHWHPTDATSMAALLCNYKTARRGMIALKYVPAPRRRASNGLPVHPLGLPLMLVRRARSFLLCVIAMVFIGVGSTSLAYGQKFESVLQDYCIQKCAEFKLIEEHREWQQKYFPMDEFPHTVEPPVGCTCPKISPPGWGGVADHTAVPKPARTTLPTAVFLVAPPTLTCVLSPRCECCHGFTT